MNNETKPFKDAIDAGCVIWPTACTCGGRYAWLEPTDRGTYKMYGCICHNPPPDAHNVCNCPVQGFTVTHVKDCMYYE